MAFQKKEEDRSLQDLKRDLEEGSAKNLYVFYGEETYLRDHYLGELKEAMLTGGLDDFNFHLLTGKDVSVLRIREAVDAMPMMSEHTFVEVVDYDMDRGDKEAMADLLSDLPEYVCLVFVYDLLEYKPDARSKVTKLVREKGRAVNFLRQTQDDLAKWIARRFRSMDHEITAADAQYLIFLCGDLMTGLISEIGKIGAYAREKRITRQDIDAVAAPQLDAVVFQLTDAIAEGNFDKAFSVMNDLLYMQEAPIKLLSVLGRQLRQLYTARLAQEKGKEPQWLMELWGMRSSYPAEKLMRSARRFSLGWCRHALQCCEEADLALKSTGADGKEVLTGLLLELAKGKAA